MPDSTATLYDASYFGDGDGGFGYVNYDEDKESQKGALQNVLRAIERHTAKGKLLDVGAATGTFVAIAKDEGWRAEGVEIGETAVDTAVSHGIPVRHGTLATISSLGHFDVITYLDVFEHLRDPRTELQEIHKRLVGDGLLVLLVPNAGGLLARLMGRWWYHFTPPEHLVWYSRENISKFLSQENFRVVTIDVISKHYTLSYCLLTFARMISARPYLAKKLARLMPNFSLSVPGTANLFVIARKQ